MRSLIYKKIKETQIKLTQPRLLNSFCKPFIGKNLLEVGGPSELFLQNSLLPIYKHAQSIDNVNFSYATIWEGEIQEGSTFKYGNRIGQQFIMEASNLNLISDSTYDGILSSHCLEHTANPIKVILEWKRVIKSDGYLLLVLPNKEFTFDHKRPITTINHLIDDYENCIGEDDLTHLEEILELHDVNKDPGLVGSLKNRSLDNFKNRCLHQHVFDDNLILQLANIVDMELFEKGHFFPYHMVYLMKAKN